MTHNRSTKELAQYCQEAAGTIAHGGAFQFFNIIYCGGGVIQEWAIPMWAEVAKFCRERQEYCFGAKSVPEIAILYPEAKTSHNAQNLYSISYPELASLRGWIDILQDSGMHSSVIYEYQLGDKLFDFPLLVVPATAKLREDSVANICRYVKQGGKVIIDRKALELFNSLSGVSAESDVERLVYLDGNGALAAAETDFAILSGEGSEICANAYGINIYNDDVYTAALRTKAGEGIAVSLAVDLGDVYNKNKSSAIREFARSLVAAAEFEPAVKVSGETSDYVEVVLTQKEGKLCVNLLNTAGAHALGSVRSYGQIPPLYDITVNIKTDAEPKQIKVGPEPYGVSSEYKGGALTVRLEKLCIHTCITLEF